VEDERHLPAVLDRIAQAGVESRPQSARGQHVGGALLALPERPKARQTYTTGIQFDNPSRQPSGCG